MNFSVLYISPLILLCQEALKRVKSNEDIVRKIDDRIWQLIDDKIIGASMADSTCVTMLQIVAKPVARLAYCHNNMTSNITAVSCSEWGDEYDLTTDIGFAPIPTQTSHLSIKSERLACVFTHQVMYHEHLHRVQIDKACAAGLQMIIDLFSYDRV